MLQQLAEYHLLLQFTYMLYHNSESTDRKCSRGNCSKVSIMMNIPSHCLQSTPSAKPLQCCGDLGDSYTEHFTMQLQQGIHGPRWRLLCYVCHWQIQGCDWSCIVYPMRTGQVFYTSRTQFSIWVFWCTSGIWFWLVWSQGFEVKDEGSSSSNAYKPMRAVINAQALPQGCHWKKNPGPGCEEFPTTNSEGPYYLKSLPDHSIWKPSLWQKARQIFFQQQWSSNHLFLNKNQ